MNSPMKNISVKMISLFMAILMFLPLAVSCAAGGNNDKSDETTTVEDTQETEPVSNRDTAALLSADLYAADGLEYAHYTIDTYYVKRSHTIKRSLTNSGACEIWYAGAFLEMLTEAYKLYPDDSKIKSTYKDVLENCLPMYLVKNGTIVSPTKTYRKMSYYNAGVNSSGDFYYDDNAWICYQLIEAYELLGDKEYLELAENNLEFLWTGWRQDGGGIYWNREFKSVGTCSTSPTGVCFLKAYMITGNEDYLEKGKQIYDWLAKNVYSGGLVLEGPGSNWKPSYDNGTFLMNASLLYKITGEKKYRNVAKSLANAVISHAFSASTTKAGKTTVALQTNPYYCPWAFTWLLRGVTEYFACIGSNTELFYDYLKILLDKRRGVKNDNGQYDPYLGTGCRDWLGDGSTFGVDDVVIMPAGYASMLLVTGYFDVFYSNSALEALEAQ